MFVTGGPMTESLCLPRRLDSAAALQLVPALLPLRNRPLRIDASEVEVMGALAFEVLLSAARQWTDDGHVLTLSRPSDPVRAAARSLGLERSMPWSEEPESA